MGQTLIAGCRHCGYEVTVSVGGTRSTFREYDPFPAICEDCHSVTSINRREAPIKCQTCNGTAVIAYGDGTRAKDPETNHTEPHPSLSWDDGLHLCPSCNGFGFEFGPTLAFYD